MNANAAQILAEMYKIYIQKNYLPVIFPQGLELYGFHSQEPSRKVPAFQNTKACRDSADQFRKVLLPNPLHTSVLIYSLTELNLTCHNSYQITGHRLVSMKTS